MPKILVADDSITVRKVAERLLTDAGLEVALAASGEEALAWLANERPDFIVTDVIMPDKSGYDVCKYVKAHADLSDTPVLLISGIVNEDVTRKAESCRADGVLKKPFQGASLQDRVLELLAKRSEKASIPDIHEEAAPESSPASSTSFDPVPPAQAVGEETTQEQVAAPAVPPAPGSSASPKVFRITEEQLQSFRQSASRIKELEAQVESEKARAERLSEQMEGAKQSESRVRELETALAEHQQRATEGQQRAEGNDELETRNKELASSLAEQQRRLADLTEQLHQFGELEKRNKDLEAALESLQSRVSQAEQEASASKGPEDRVPQLQSMITDQQQRLSDLANQVIRFSESETKVKALETSLANEQSRANEMEQRCADMERAAARATMRLEDITRLLAQIARLASKPEETQDSASS